MIARKSEGFTLVEVSATVTILVLAIGMALGGYVYTLKHVNTGDIQNDLDIDVQLSMESLKQDLRLSSLDTIFYYPSGSGPYEAISFPKAYDSDGDGMLEMNDEGKIVWDETVIYHVRPTTPHQLVKTVFKPRDNSLTDAQRQDQLESVVKYGHANNTHNSRNATSQILFANLLNWKINPKEGRFDAYADTISRDRANLGYVLLDPGTHTITFDVIGKNPQSSGYHIGVDQLVVSASGSAREAEAQLPATTQSGATAVNQYIPVGSWKGKHQLHFPAGGTGNSFTLTMDNDRWEETNFGGTGYLAEDTYVDFIETSDPKDYVVQLDGMDETWDAAAQTGSEAHDTTPGLMKNWVVRVMQKGSELADNGNWFNYNGRQCRLKFKAARTGNFKVTNVYIGESASTTNSSMDFNSATVKQVKFDISGATKAYSPTAPPGGEIVSNWVDFEIDKDKNYLVSYRIANSGSLCHPALWKDTRDSVAMTCLVVTNGSSATAKDQSWSDSTGIDPLPLDGILGLSSIEASHPADGTYVSQIFDTRLDSPQFKDIAWTADLPPSTALSFKVRSGSESDLSDAADWTYYSPFSATTSQGTKALSLSSKRYIQFQALLTSSGDGQSTPKLKDVTINWDGTRQLVDVGGIFTKGPNYGTFEVSIDGQPLRSALIIDLEIYKDAFAMKGESRRMTSSMKIELAPRNSGL